MTYTLTLVHVTDVIVHTFLLFALLLQLHQDSSRSYKEVCAPVVERCCFLFNEIRPAVCHDRDRRAVRSLLLGNTSTCRWKQVIQRIISKQGQGLLSSTLLYQHSTNNSWTMF